MDALRVVHNMYKKLQRCMYSMYVCTIHYHAPTLYLNGFPIRVSYVYTMCVLHTFCGVPVAVIFLDEALLEVEE